MKQNQPAKCSRASWWCALIFMAMAALIPPAQAAFPATESSDRLLDQIEPRIKAIYERNEFAMRSFMCAC